MQPHCHLSPPLAKVVSEQEERLQWGNADGMQEMREEEASANDRIRKES